MNLKKLISKFCASCEYGRRAMEVPFSIGDWTYATDARIIIRVPKIKGIKGYPGFPQKAPDLFVGRFERLRGFTYLPTKLPAFKKDDCDCLDAWGDRRPYPRCLRCLGTGKENAITWVKIGRHHYQLKYLLLMREFSCVRIDPRHRDGQPMRFLFLDDNGFTGQGLLMPKRNKPKTRL